MARIEIHDIDGWHENQWNRVVIKRDGENFTPQASQAYNEGVDEMLAASESGYDEKSYALLVSGGESMFVYAQHAEASLYGFASSLESVLDGDSVFYREFEMTDISFHHSLNVEKWVKV